MGVIAGVNAVNDGLIFTIDAGNFRSYSGSGNTSNGLVGGIGGTLVNGIGFTSANSGSFIFDGTNDYIDVPINPSLFTTEGTMIIWLKNDEATPASTSNTGFMGFSSGYQNDHYPWIDGLGYLSTFRNNRVSLTLSTSVTRTNIHMVCVTSNSSEWKLYQNAVLQYTTSSSGSVTMSNTTIGYSISQSFNYKGKVYSFSLYNRALSAAEVLQNYNSTKRRYV